ncbi:MAG TPA: TPM domain-containing protein [Candidatus Eisenbacteria bacterium]
MISSSRTTVRRRRSRPRGATALARAAAFALGALAVALALGAAPAAAREWPAPVGHVNDFARVLDAASADSMESLARELREKCGSELAVVTLPDLGGEEIEPVATDLFAAWGIGRKAENDGVLILLAAEERRVRIEVGYGLEGALPDGRCGGIIRLVMGPDLSADRFGPGLLRGARAVAAVIAQEKGVTLTGVAGVVPPPLAGERGGNGSAFLTLLALAILFITLARVGAMGSRRRFRRGGFFGPWGGFGGFGGMGGFGSGGSGGGFGGFGGGMSGGGGASGRF